MNNVVCLLINHITNNHFRFTDCELLLQLLCSAQACQQLNFAPKNVRYCTLRTRCHQQLSINDKPTPRSMLSTALVFWKFEVVVVELQ